MASSSSARALAMATASSTGLAFLHRVQGARPFEDLREIPSLVADPRAVDRRILERRDALDLDVLLLVQRVELPLRLAVPDLHRAAASASRADRRRGRQIPDPRLVEERPRQQRADRADVDDVVGVRIVVERMVLGRADQRGVAALRDAERVRLRYLAREAHATRAQDAALVVEHDALGERMEFGRVHLGVERNGRRAVVPVVIVLQRALAGLVADAAVDRVIQRQQLHDALAVLLDDVGVRQHAQALAHRHVARDLDPAAVLDLDRAHAAVAGHRQLRMPAEVGNEEAVGARGLHHRLVALRVDGLPVYEDARHSRFPSLRERLCSMKCSNSSRNLFRMPLVA